MAMKPKAHQNPGFDDLSSKPGRPTRDYGIEDAVRMVSLIVKNGVKVTPF